MTTRADYQSKRDTELRVLILQNLVNTPDGYLMREPDMLATVRHAMVPEVIPGEFSRAIAWLETEDCITGIRNPLIRERRWAITERGRTLISAV